MLPAVLIVDVLRYVHTGSPYTLGQAQQHLKKSALGPCITFVQADPLHHLSQADTQRYTTAILAHSIWYFSSPSTLSALLSSLATRVKRICIAEYALSSADMRAAPHVLAALTQAALECRKPISCSIAKFVPKWLQAREDVPEDHRTFTLRFLIVRENQEKSNAQNIWLYKGICHAPSTFLVFL